MIRKAKLEDVKTIHKIIGEQARFGHVLARAMTDLYSQIRDFTVCVNDESGEIVGCGALKIVWEDLAEIRSVAVQSSFQNAGLGSQLIEALINEANSMGIKRVFVLTYRVRLFERLG
ncbi:MAG: GNAT family N-acetyltransferase, partial [Desulfomonilaceae bacterium]